MAYASAILTKRDEEVGSLGLWSGWWDLERVKYCLLGGEGGLVGCCFILVVVVEGDCPWEG